MIPILFEPTATDFTTNGLGRLPEARLCKVTEERNGIYELTMDYPISAPLFSQIQNESLIVAIPFKGGSRQAFSVYEILDPINGVSTISAQHISYRANDIPIKPFLATGITETLNQLNSAANAFEPNPFTVTSDIENIDTPYSFVVPKSLRACLGGEEGSLLDKFSSRGTGEFEWDNFNIKFWEHRGSDKGYTIRYAKNLQDLRRTKNTADVATGILPYWHNDEQGIFIWGEVQYAEDANQYPIKRTKVLDCNDHFSEQPRIQDLNNYASAYVNGLDQLKETMEIQFYDIENQNINLCDTVHVYHPKLDIKYEKKVIKTVWNVLTERYESITLGDNKSDLASTLTKAIQDVKNYTNNKFINVTQYVDKENGRIYDRIDEIEEDLGDTLTGISTLFIQVNEGVTPSQTDPNWSTVYPDKEEGKRIWTENRMDFSDGHAEYSTPHDITDEGIIDAKVQYCKSTSNQTPPVGPWTYILPPMEEGYYLWTRNEYTTTDGSITHTQATLALNQLYSTIVSHSTSIDQTQSYIQLHQEDINNITKMNGVNFSPYFSRSFSDIYDSEDNLGGYWAVLNDSNVLNESTDGWAHVASSTGNHTVEFYPEVNTDLESDNATLLVEIKGATYGSGASFTVKCENNSVYRAQYYSNSTLSSPDNGVFRIALNKSVPEDPDDPAGLPNVLTHTSFVVSGSVDLYVRISIYRDSYPGDYVPYMGLTDQLNYIETRINDNYYASTKYADGAIDTVAGRVKTIENNYVTEEDAKTIASEGTKQWYETSFKQDYQGFQARVDSGIGDLNTKMADYSMVFDLTADGVIIGKSTSDIKGKFDNDSLDFIDNANKKLAWVDATDGLGGDRLSIGEAATNNKRWNIFTSDNGNYLRFTRHS